MNPADYNVRRATTDDMDQLIALWKSAHLPADELDKRFTEFQIIESVGKIFGAIGLQISGAEGKLHSEAYVDFGLTDSLRPLLWERIRKVAENNGLFRLWTNEQAPFWKKECGFNFPSAETLAKIPPQFGKADTMLQLKEDRAAPSAIEAEFARFKAEEGERTQKLYEQARLFKGIAYALSILLFIFVAIGLFYVYRYRSNLQH